MQVKEEGMSAEINTSHELEGIGWDHRELETPGEECGVFGIYAPGENIAGLTYKGLFAEQHRGQDGAGIAVLSRDSGNIAIVKGEGLLTNVFNDNARSLESLAEGPVAVGHVRYGTVDKRRGISDIGSQAAGPQGGANYVFSMAHNGHMEGLNPVGEKYGVDVTDSVSDSDLLSKVLDIQAYEYGDMIKAIDEVLPKVKGAFTLVFGERNRLIGVRDPHGFRPLSIGILPGGGFVLASETIALDKVGAKFFRDVEAGEVVEIGPEGLTSHFLDTKIDEKLCSFEFVYFSNQCSMLRGVNVHQARERMGRFLAEDHPVEADVVIGVPNSGLSAAKGYARASGISDEPGLEKSNYAARSFIIENRLSRKEAVERKFNINRHLVMGNRVVLVDDSLVRGTTTKILVETLRKAGAAEVHLRIPSPPYAWPCFYGMDTRRPEELIAYNKTIQEICEYVGADSLAYLSPERLVEAIALPLGSLCTACTTGIYPTEIPIELSRKPLSATG